MFNPRLYLPSIFSHPPFVSFPHLVSFFISVFPQFLPPTVNCMAELSLRGRCIVPACTFLISCDMVPEDLAAPFNAVASCLCLWSWPQNSFASHERLWCCTPTSIPTRAAGSLYHTAYYGITNHLLLWSYRVWRFLTSHLFSCLPLTSFLIAGLSFTLLLSYCSENPLKMCNNHNVVNVVCNDVTHGLSMSRTVQWFYVSFGVCILTHHLCISLYFIFLSIF